MDPTTLRLMQGAAGAVSATYIEDVFSTWLYTGNGSTQTITNGIDLSGKGGLVWTKSRTSAEWHRFGDTSRGTEFYLSSNNTNAQQSITDAITSFSSNGYSIGATLSTSSTNYASWTFRKAAKFFDVVTYTGNGSNRTIAHNLGSVPGMIIVKRTDTTGNWNVYHRSLGATKYLLLENTQGEATASTVWNDTSPTASVFSVGTYSGVNASGGTYVAYIFAHDTGTDGLIQCGSYTGNGSTTGPTVSLGWEPQWVILKSVSAGSSGNWIIYDTMRGVPVGSNPQILYANTSGAEVSASWAQLSVNPTGFQIASADGWLNANGETYIYIAIRRGPMKTPTDATKVFTALAATGSTNTSRTVGFPADLSFTRWRSGVTAMQAVDRLRGMPTSSNANALLTSSTAAEAGTSPYAYDIWNTTAKDGSNANLNDMVWQYFRRAPGFFDVVAFLGNAASRTLNHNLAAVPELMIFKCRDAALGWGVYSAALAASENLVLQTDAAKASSATIWDNTRPTSTVFSVGANSVSNANNGNMIAYLFATCPGVSKVGSYTGTGTTKQIDCGFTAGARFVLIKRTDSTGDWYVWDSARGIVAGNDPYLLLNSTAAEVTSTDYVDTYSAGFEISSTAPAAINANGGSFIFLAVA